MLRRDSSHHGSGSSEGVVRAEFFDWTVPYTGPKFDVLLACDVLYEVTSVPARLNINTKIVTSLVASMEGLETAIIAGLVQVGSRDSQGWGVSRLVLFETT